MMTFVSGTTSRPTWFSLPVATFLRVTDSSTSTVTSCSVSPAAFAGAVCDTAVRRRLVAEVGIGDGSSGGPGVRSHRARQVVVPGAGQQGQRRQQRDKPTSPEHVH